jgi:hypothetical protein
MNSTLASYEEQQQIIQKKRSSKMIGMPLRAPRSLPPRDLMLGGLQKRVSLAATPAAPAAKKRRIDDTASRICLESTMASKLEFPCAVKSLTQDEQIFVEAAQKLRKCPSPEVAPPSPEAATSPTSTNTNITTTIEERSASPKHVTPHGSATSSPVAHEAKKVWTQLPTALRL